MNIEQSWNGLSVALEGDTLVLGDPLGSARFEGYGDVYSYDLAAAIVDEDSNGVADGWQIKQDYQPGAGQFSSRIDLNGNGRLDSAEAASTSNCIHEIVILFDNSTSTSPTDTLTARQELFLLADNLSDIDTVVTTLALGDYFEVDMDGNGTMRGLDGVVRDLSNIIPCSDSDWVPDNQSCNGCTRFYFDNGDFIGRNFTSTRPMPIGNPDSVQTGEGFRESWAPGNAITCEFYQWTSSSRSVIIITDENSCFGDLDAGGMMDMNPGDLAAAASSRQVAVRNGVYVFPLITRTLAAPDSLRSQAFQIAGQPLDGSGTPVSDGLGFEGQVFSVGSKGQISELGEVGGALRTALDALPEPIGCSDPCPGDADGNSAVDLADLNLVLANFGTVVAPSTSGDVTGDGNVDLADLNLVLANFGSTCGEAASQKSFSMSMQGDEFPVTLRMMLKDHPNADAWLDQIAPLPMPGKKMSTDDLKAWVDSWQQAN